MMNVRVDQIAMTKIVLSLISKEMVQNVERRRPRVTNPIVKILNHNWKSYASWWSCRLL